MQIKNLEWKLRICIDERFCNKKIAKFNYSFASKKEGKKDKSQSKVLNASKSGNWTYL